MDITSILYKIGIHSDKMVMLVKIIGTFILSALAGWVTYVIAKKWLAKLIMKFIKKTSFQWDDLLFDNRFLGRLAVLIALIITRITLSTIEWKQIVFFTKPIDILIVIVTAMLIASILDGLNRIYDKFSISKDRPIKVFIQVFKIFLYCAALMVVINIFTGKSLIVLLGGLTAFAAVLMLIFQDTILGFVAGIQINANNMVRIGDWIAMSSRGADGTVTEINLTTVKVQNWDNTITTIPTHKLVAESFTNWRGMQESGGRRVKRSVNIDITSIHILSAAEIEELKQSSLLKNYINNKLIDLEYINVNKDNVLDQYRLTNIGVLRKYLELWLKNNPNINTEMTCMVRQLQAGPTGLPIEIYCFAANKQWVNYETIQADIFDHIFAVMPVFYLKVYQYFGFMEN